MVAYRPGALPHPAPAGRHKDRTDAGILGLELDRLRQRESQRRHRQKLAIVDFYLKISKTQYNGYKPAPDGAGNSTPFFYKYEGGTDLKGNVDVSELNKKTKVRIRAGNKSTRDNFWFIDVVPKSKSGPNNNEFT